MTDPPSINLFVLDHKNRIGNLLPEWRREPSGVERTGFAFVCPVCFDDIVVDGTKVTGAGEDSVSIAGTVHHECGFLGKVKDGAVLYRVPEETKVT